VVIAIIILVSAVVLPVVLPALQSRQVGEGARIVQAALAGVRDAAIRANAPRGIRLLPDLTLSNAASGILVSNRIVPIEPAPGINDGMATFAPVMAPSSVATTTWGRGNPPPFPFPTQAPGAVAKGPYYPPYYPAAPLSVGGPSVRVLMVVQSVYQANNPAQGIPNAPTNWFWNVRIGDKVRLNDSGRYYTVVGPMTTTNPELYVNDCDPKSNEPLNHSSLTIRYTALGRAISPEFLFLVNGVDDDSDGYVDNGVNGLDENLNFDPGGNPYIDEPIEWTEQEKWLGTQDALSQSVSPPEFPYTIVRRPVPTPGAREVGLPASVVIDLTTWNTTAERSRLIVDPLTLTVDVMMDQAGRVIPTTEYSCPASFPMNGAFFHCWVADRIDVFAPSGTNTYPQLPVPQGTPNLAAGVKTFLKRDRQLLTLSTRSGQVVTNSVNNFDASDPDLPYREAQLGVREDK
jgi:hypothetical protein